MNCRNLKYNVDELKLVALGDVHFGGKECDIELFKKKVEWIKTQKNIAVILMGDMINCGTKVSVGAGTFDNFNCRCRIVCIYNFRCAGIRVVDKRNGRRVFINRI